MKNFKRVSALLMALVLVFGLLPALVLAESDQSEPTAVTPAVGDSVLFANQVTADAAWAGAGSTLSDGTSKVVAAWDATYLYFVYATKAGAAATINGEDAAVTAGATYDVAKIALTQIGFEPADFNSYFEVELSVGSATWEGLVALRNDEVFVTKNAFAPTQNSGFPNGSLATPYNWVATDTALGSGQRINYQANVNGTNKFYSVSTNGYVVDFDLDLTTMPVLSMNDATLAANTYHPLTTGVTIAMVDPFTNAASVDANGNVLEGAANRNHIFYTIAKNASGWKLLTYGAGRRNLITDLGTDLGTQIHVHTETVYDNATKGNVTLKVYINDKLVLTSTVARNTDTALGTTPTANTLGFLAMVNNFDTINDQSHAKNNIQAANITISGVKIAEINDGVPEILDPVIPNPDEDPVIPNPDEDPVIPNPDEDPVIPDSDDPVVGDNFIFAVKGEEADIVWEKANGQLAAGEKFGVAWYGNYLHIIYAKQGVKTFKINDMDAIVVRGNTYDIAVISYEDLGMEVTSGNGCYPLTLEVNGKTWDGFVVLSDLGDDVVEDGHDTAGVSATANQYAAYSLWRRCNTSAIEIVANEPVVMEWDINVKKMPTSCDPEEITSWRGGWHTGYDYSWVKGISFVLYDPFTANANSGVQKCYIPVSLIQDENGDLYVIYCDNAGQFKNVKLEGVTLDAVKGTDMHFRVELTYADATNPTVAMKCYLNDLFLFESSDARSPINTGSKPGDDRFGMKVYGSNYDVISNDATHSAWVNNKVSEAVDAGALVLGNFEAIDFKLTNYTTKTLNAEFELPEDPDLELPNPGDEDIVPPAEMFVGDKVVFAEKGAAGDDVWAAAQGQLAAGEKFGVAWYGTCLHIIYAKQGVDTFKVNGMDATVIKGDSYDIAVISYEDLGIRVTAANVPYDLKLEVNGKTWNGLVVLNDLGDDVVEEGNDTAVVSATADEYVAYSLWRKCYASAIEIVANQPVVMDWDVNVKELPTSCDPDEITSWRGGWHTGYDYSWVKGISFALYDPFSADADSGVQKKWIPISLIKDENGDLYVIYCDNAGQFKNVKLEGVTLDAENGTDLHFRVELTYADASNPTVAMKCYVNDTFLFESADARSSVNTGSTPGADRFGMKVFGSNYDVISNDATHSAWENNKVSEAVDAGALVLGNFEAIDFAMANYTVKALNAEFELPEDPAGGAPAPTGDTNEVALYAALLVTSLLGMVALVIPTIRKKLF